jgi:DNA (cytosine-5)-methyltransferase 1
VTLTVGSLFSGIGGIDLGLERAGMTVKWHSEIDPYACRVLKKHWPDVPNLGNIKEIDWATVELVDVIAGGYPCQPFSTAGKRQGDKDERHLWPYFLRAISELRPRFALLENVRGHLSMGFERVLGDLAEIGYNAEWQIVSAASVGAPHRRDRIICVAYPNRCDPSDGRERENVSGQGAGWRHDGSGSASDIGQVSLGSPRQIAKDVADTNQPRRKHGNKNRSTQAQNGQRPKVFVQNFASNSNFRPFSHWLLEPDVGRVAHGIPSRVDRLRGLGNAVVPQVAEYVGRMIMASL